MIITRIITTTMGTMIVSVVDIPDDDVETSETEKIKQYEIQHSKVTISHGKI